MTAHLLPLPVRLAGLTLPLFTGWGLIDTQAQVQQVSAAAHAPASVDYRAAYQLIIRSLEFPEFAGKHPRVAVYDSIVPILGMGNFFAEIRRARPGSRLTDAVLIDSLGRAGEAQSPAYYLPAVARLTRRSPLRKGTVMVAFSARQGEFMLAEVTRNQYGPSRFARVQRFDQSILYLLRLTKPGQPKIIRVLEVAYN